jgi:hypothetical protein
MQRIFFTESRFDLFVWLCQSLLDHVLQFSFQRAYSRSPESFSHDIHMYSMAIVFIGACEWTGGQA